MADSFVIRSLQQSNPSPVPEPAGPQRRRGGQPGNINALRHGLRSERFNPLRLQSLLDQPLPEQDSPPPDSALNRHLHILQAAIEDLTQAAADGQAAAVPLLLNAIRSHATLAALSFSLQHPQARRLRNNPEGHTKCAACDTWCQNQFLTPDALCRNCANS